MNIRGYSGDLIYPKKEAKKKMHFSFRAILKQQKKKTSSTSISSRIHITYTHTHGHIFCTFIFQLMIAIDKR